MADDSYVDLQLGETPAPATPEWSAARRLERRELIDQRQQLLGRVIASAGCEAAMLFVPAHVSWFCAGFNVRGLLAESERPGLYTNGKQRWLLCSNLDTQRLFDEELDRLGFQVKEWPWTTGRATMLNELTAGRKIAADRPFPGMPLINDALRTEIRPLANYDLWQYQHLGEVTAHAVEAVARTMPRGTTEWELAGQIAHRLLRHGVELVSASVSHGDRLLWHPRPGLQDEPTTGLIRLQATGQKDGLYVTLSRSVCWGPLRDEDRSTYELATKLSAVYRAYLQPEETFGHAGEAGRKLTHGTPYDYEWRYAPIGYGTGRLPAEELRRFGQEERLVLHQAVVTQARCRHHLIQDTLLVTPSGGETVTPPTDWPFKRIKLFDRNYDIPDILVRVDSH